MQKKIVFFTGSMGRGGAERVISILSDHYAKKDWDVTIAMVLHSNVEYQLNEKIRVVDLSSPKGIKKGALETRKKIRSFIREKNPDVIVSFMAQICLIVGLSLGKTKARMIMSERIDPSGVSRNFVYKKLLDHVYRQADVVVLQTKRAKNYFNKKIQAKGELIANPVKVYAEATGEDHRIVTAGRLTSQKNQKMLISAFSEIYQKHPEYTLTIYGDGPLRDALETQVRELGLEAVVQLPGNSPDLHREISNAEIFVLPSDFEGLSNALLEAMMMGFPVISTDCAGSDEVIEPMENGMLIPVGDRDKLVEALELLISDPVLRAKLSRNAKNSVEYCKVESIVSKWADVIEKNL